MALDLVYKKSLGRSYRIADNALEQLVSHDWASMDESDRMAFQGIESTEPRMLHHGFQSNIIDGNNLEIYASDGTIHQFELVLVNTLNPDTPSMDIFNKNRNREEGKYYSEVDKSVEEVIQDPYSRDGRKG